MLYRTRCVAARTRSIKKILCLYNFWAFTYSLSFEICSFSIDTLATLFSLLEAVLVRVSRDRARGVRLRIFLDVFECRILWPFNVYSVLKKENVRGPDRENVREKGLNCRKTIHGPFTTTTRSRTHRCWFVTFAAKQRRVCFLGLPTLTIWPRIFSFLPKLKFTLENREIRKSKTSKKIRRRTYARFKSAYQNCFQNGV